MIPLNIQIKMIIFSFAYGIIFFVVLKYLKKLFYKKYIFSIIFGIMNGVLYFFLLKIINDGILNINLLIYFVIGFYVCKVCLEKK